MPLFSNTDQIGARYAAQVHEFRKLYEFHSLRNGSPQDFVQLAPKLASSEGFRLDFSDRVRRVRDGERGGLSAGEMLTIVGVAIGGAGIAGAELELYESAGTVQVLLAGVGGWREPGPAGVGAADAMEAKDAGSGEYPQAMVHDQEGDGGGAKHEPWGGHASGERNGGGEVSPEMKEALARLEMASLQLKVYLDDIDRRMGRIEPHLDDLTAMVQTSAEHFQRFERGAREPQPGALAGKGIAEEVVRPRRLRADEAIAVAMERASQEQKAEPVGLSAAEGEAEENDAGEADEVIAPAAMIPDHAVEEERRVEPKGRPIGWERRSGTAAEPKAAELSQAAAAEIGSEDKVGAESGDDAAMEVVAGGRAAVSAPVDLQPAAVPKIGAGVKRRVAWGAAAAVFLIAAASVAYVYQPWYLGAQQAAAVTRPATAAADGAREAGQSGASAMSPGDGGRLRSVAAVSNASASANRRRGESAVRQPSGAQTGRTQADGAAPLKKAEGGGNAGAAPVLAAMTNLPATGTAAGTDAAAGQARPQGEPPKDRVEGARAADVSKAPRVEDLHPETTGERAASGGGPSPRIETAAMVSKVSAPAAFGPSAASPGTGDVPRSSIGRTEVVPQTISVALLSAPSPNYPQQARQLGVEGQVVIQATVNKSGTVTSARVVGGPFLLRQSAQNAVMRRRYKPYLLHGDPTEFQTLVTLNYKLSK